MSNSELEDPRLDEDEAEEADEIAQEAVSGQTLQTAVAARTPLELVWSRLRRDTTAMVSVAVIHFGRTPGLPGSGRSRHWPTAR